MKKGSGIEKETMSSARRRILESISLPLADPLPAREENSGLPPVDARYQCISFPG